jgi:hypothetical protein
VSIASVTPPEDSVADIDSSKKRWYDKLLGLLIAILCFEMGIFLIAFPWSGYWARSFFAWISPEWREVWMNPYFRGAVSGAGLLNLYLSLVEVFRLQGSARRHDEQS